MPNIKYVGPFDAVEVDGLGVVSRGESVDAPHDLAASLLEQTDNWSADKPATKTESKES